MYIIFGDAINQIPDSYTKLELDTIRIEPGSREFKTWCVVEAIPLPEFPVVEHNKKIHSDLIEQYRKQNWEFCEQAIDALVGKWNCEVDSFYDDLRQRIIEYKQTPPTTDWNWTIIKAIQG